MKNILIVGFGFMGTMHAQAYRQLSSQARLVGIVDNNPVHTKEMMKNLKFDLPVYSNLKEALCVEAVDAVDICLPTDLHLRVALESIAAGKHVICEKPIALNIVDAEKMCFEAEQAGVQLMIAHSIRFWPEYQKLAEWVESGEMGRLCSVHFLRRSGRPMGRVEDWVNHPERCFGAALDMHIHDSDYIQHILGLPKAVFSRGVQEPSGWNYITTQYLFDEVVVSAEGGWNHPADWGFQMAFHAVFENGTVDYDSRSQDGLTRIVHGQKMEKVLLVRPKTEGDIVSSGNIPDLGGYYRELEYFVNCLQQGCSIEVSHGRHATNSLKLTLAEIESAKCGKVIYLS